MDALGLIFLASQKKGDVWLGFWGGIWVSGIQGMLWAQIWTHPVPTVISLPPSPWGCLWMGLAAWVPRVINP